MDDDDSQDELINKNMCHSKGKRAALWAISDDSDDVEEESEVGESDSGEEEGEDHRDEQDDEEYEEGNEEEDDEETDEEEEDAKAENGAFGGTSADLAGLSSDEDTDKCPICLNSFLSQPVATPESCEHYFCLDCILEWSKNANSCPVDRIAFNSIYLRKCYGGKVKKMITVQKPVKEGQEESADLELEQTSCEVCGGSDREDRLLLCDGCDAGYHMECLTPPLDSVPVEEWFCPECEANNRHSRDSAQDLSDTDSLPSTARPATSRSQSHAAGPTRAIARTQQSERVRANVNRHRITQARTSQLAPTYLIQSTWLDETINAVVAGLNTSVYIRDFTPRIPSGQRRKTRKRRKVKRKKTSSSLGKVAGTGVKRRKRKVRRTKSRKKLAVKKSFTTRGRIASNLGIVKDKKSSSLPTVYRPSEHTLSGMRADIGAASLSIYGDPFDLDPFVEHEEEEHQAHVTTLLEAKRRGISRSALRSHQPVARPVTASLSRRGMNVPQSGGVVEAAPVPDLLGSILSGQSMLLMDSSDVVINRDGSLKATKPVIPSALTPVCNKSSSSGDASTQFISAMSPKQGDSSRSPHYNEDLPGSSHSSTNRTFTSFSNIQPPLHSDLPSRGLPSSQPAPLSRPTHPPGQQGTNGVRAPKHTSSIHPASSSKSKGIASSQSQSKKAPAKPMWIDVSVLPRIPKIKRENSSIRNDGGNRSSSRRENCNNSTASSNGHGVPETGMISLAGNKGRQRSVDQQRSRVDGPSQRQRPDGAGSSSAFSNSFSSSSSSTGSPASQPRYSSSSSSSSAVSFRINPSGNAWHSRRLSVTSSLATGGSMQEPRRQKEDEARKRQLHRDKQMLLASRTHVSKEQDSNNIYDPFDPTHSDSDSSEDEAESTSLNGSRYATGERKPPSLQNEDGSEKSTQDSVHVKSEMQEIEISEEEPRRCSGDAQETILQEVGSSEANVKVEKESRLVGTEIEKQTSLKIKVKKEPCSDDAGKTKRFGDSAKSLNSETTDTEPPGHRSLDLFKAERETLKEESQSPTTPLTAPPLNCKSNSSASSSAQSKKKHKAENKMDTKSRSKSPSSDSTKKAVQASKERCSFSPERERHKRGDPTSSQAGRQREKEDRNRSSRRSRSRERRRARSTSESLQSSSPDGACRKRQRSQSRHEDRRRSRSGSSSSSREHSQRKRNKQRSNERNEGRERDYVGRRVSEVKRHGRSRSKSRSKSRSRSRSRSTSRSRGYKYGQNSSKSRSKSRSRSRERRKDHTQSSSHPSRDKGQSHSKDNRRRRSRSSSRERGKEERSSSKSSQKTSGSCFSSSKDTKQAKVKKKEKDTTQSSLKEEKVIKQETFSSQVKNEGIDIKTENQAATSERAKHKEILKEIKKEKQPSLDMFGDSPIAKPVKEEETVIQSFTEVQGVDEENKKDPIKTETCEIPIIKSEPSFPELCDITAVHSVSILTTAVTADSLQEKVSKPHSDGLMTSDEQPNAVALTVPIKQEVQPPSDSDDDFNVDIMLDNLDCVKSECTEASSASVKQEMDEEGKNESTVVGVKTKTQVKRVTWNIQEPEGPQPEKSSSKLALYKLRLKQEGARRPCMTNQTPSQDITRVVSDPSKKGSVKVLSSSSRSDGVQSEESSTCGQGDAEEGDLSRKDKYLKKLHMQERAIEEVKLAIKPFYQRRDINKEEYKEILRKAVQKVCHSKSGEINPVKVGNLVKAYVDKYKHARKHKRGDDSGKAQEVQTEAMEKSDSP